MTRLIDADVLTADILAMPDCPNGFSETYDKACIIEMIEEQPTVDTVPVRHAKWIHDGYDNPHGVDWMHCSECGSRDVYCPAAMTSYCPNCGARMDEE